MDQIISDNAQVEIAGKAKDIFHAYVIGYNDIIDHIEKDADDLTVWKLRRITAHEGPLTHSHPTYK